MVRLGAWQFRSPVHYFYIPGITEDPVAFFARQFPHNAQVLQMIQALVDCGRGDADQLSNKNSGAGIPTTFSSRKKVFLVTKIPLPKLRFMVV